MDADPRRRVAIFLHDGAYDRVHQACSIAAAAASSGRDVQLFLFWWALDGLLAGAFEHPRFDGEGRAVEAAQDAFEKGAPTAAALLAAARETGHCTVYACSASAALLGRRQDEIAGKVDLVVGWTAILSLTAGVIDRFYL
jgi:peroxiredoxin family protein